MCTIAVCGLDSDAGAMYSECCDHSGAILGRLGIIQSHTSRLWPLQSETFTLSDGDIAHRCGVVYRALAIARSGSGCGPVLYIFKWLALALEPLKKCILEQCPD